MDATRQLYHLITMRLEVNNMPTTQVKDAIEPLKSSLFGASTSVNTTTSQ